MKKYNYYGLASLILLLVAVCSVKAQGFAQNPPPPDEAGDPPRNRASLIRELGLSRDQMRELRAINQERRREMQAAQMRLREANRALDKAVYADVENDAEIQARIREVQKAQADLILNRTITERRIRQILTLQQLAQFRDLRARFMENQTLPRAAAPKQPRLKNLPQNIRRQRLQNRQKSASAN